MILDEIAAKRLVQLERERAALPLETVKAAAEKQNQNGNLLAALKGGRLSVIAEIKKASPSKGLICPDFHPAQTAVVYEASGADAISVLTEEAYFQGSSAYLREVRKTVDLPILRKDFIIDPYQIYEAKAIGADAILLIAALLPKEKLKEFARLADSLGLDSLMEVHNERELDAVLNAGAGMIGINNRDLKTFQVDLQTTGRLAKLVPNDRVLVSESGIVTHNDLRAVRSAGADAVLIGETLMRSRDVASTLRELRDGL